MGEARLLRLSASAAVKERRLETLLGGRAEDDPRLREVVEDACLLGSLELAGLPVTWEQLVASRRGGVPPPEPARRLRAAQQAVEVSRPFSVAALRTWHAAATGGDGSWRSGERAREGGPPPAPAALVAERLAVLEQWLAAGSSRELKPAQLGALVLARIVEIRPFDDANGRVSRLAATHLMVRAGARPPVLVAGDGPRLVQALQAAFRLDTEPLCALLEEASERALEVMIRTLERERGE